MPTRVQARSIRIMEYRCSKVHAAVRLAMAPRISVYTGRVALVAAAVDAEQEVCPRHKYFTAHNVV